MRVNYLEQLDDAVRLLLSRGSVQGAIDDLKASLRRSEEPFVWKVLDLDALGCDLPGTIKSGWIFVLKRGVPSGCHHHPNSIQHMVLVEGRGESTVAGVTRRMVPFGSSDHGLDERWYVIGERVPHEFFPEERDMVVVSFHTCAAQELEEVHCQTGEQRRYEGTRAG